MVETFKYSDDEWRAIDQNLPSLKAPQVDFPVARSQRFRQIMEDFAEEWISGKIQRMTEMFRGFPGETALLEKVGSAISSLEDELNRYSKRADPSAVELLFYFCFATDDVPNEDQERQFREALHNLRMGVENRAQNLNTGRKNNPNDLARDYYMGHLLNFWRDRGGKLKASNPKNKKPVGPLMKYLFSAVYPVYRKAGMEPPTLEALREFIRRAKGNKIMFVPIARHLNEEMVKQSP
jgi:hypothetical protein